MTEASGDLRERIGQPIIVLGVDRSGTSLLASLIYHWGAYGGDPAVLRRGNRNNPRGYFENRQMQAFLASNLGVAFYRSEYEARLRQRAADSDVRAKALDLMAEMASHDRVWFWKEPYLSTSLTFWREVWGDALYVIPVRHPYETALSMEKLVLPERAEPRLRLVGSSLLRWQYFMLCILEGTKGSRNRVLVSYDRLLAEPAKECRRLCLFLDRACGIEGRSEDRLQRMSAAVDARLHRNQAACPLAEVPEATAAQRGLYDLLKRLSDDEDVEFDPDRYPLYEGWREYLENVDKILRYYGRAQAVLENPLVRAASSFLFEAGQLSQRLRRVTRRVLGPSPNQQAVPAARPQAKVLR